MKIKVSNNGVITEEIIENGIVLRTKQGKIHNNIINVQGVEWKLNPIFTKVFPVEDGEDFSVDICTNPRIKEVLDVFAEYPNLPMLEFHRGDLHIEITI